MSSRSGSSRRKPAQVSRAILENSSDEDEDDAGSLSRKKVNGDSQSEEDILEELPEGTVVVNPEPVEEKNPTFKGPEFVSGKRKSTGVVDASGLMARVTCTACHKQINTNKKGSARRHPLLKVLICKRCRTYYDSGPIQKDKDGLDEQCRWCGEGGRLFGCDFCHNAFCRSCIIHNLGRSELMRVQNDDKWKCYVCNSKALRPQRHECEAVLEQIKKEEQKAKNALEREKEREKSREKKDTPSSKHTPSSKSSDTAKNTPSSKSSDAKNTPSSRSSDTKQSSVKSAGGKIAPGINPKVELVVVGPKTPNALPPKQMPMSMTSQQKSLGPAQQQLKNLLSMPGVSQQKPVQRMIKPQMPMSSQGMGRVGFMSSLDPSSVTLPILIEEFKKNLTPTTIPQVLAKLMSITNSLTLMMSSIKMNIMDNRINSPGFESINAMNLQSRKTAIDCLVSGLELFLQELQITTVGEYVPAPQGKSDFKGANGSTADSGNANDSEPEVVEIESPKKSLKMVKINDQIIVESDSEEEVIPVDVDVSQKDDIKKENDENSITVDKEATEKVPEDKSSNDEDMEVGDSTSKDKEDSTSEDKEDTTSKDKEDTTSKDKEDTTSKDKEDTPSRNKEKLDKKSKEESPKKKSNTGTESPKKAKKSCDEKEENDNVDSENTEAQLELLKELADELIKNGNKTDSESDDENTVCEGEEDDNCQNKEQSDEEEEAENVVKEKESNDTSESESSKVKKSKDNKKKNNKKEDEIDKQKSEDEEENKQNKTVKKKNNKKEDEKDKQKSEDEEENKQNKTVSSASSNDESDSDSEDSDESGPKRRLRKRKAKKEDEKPEKKGKGSLKIRLKLPSKSKSQKEEKKGKRRSSRSKPAEESQDSDENDSISKGKDKKGKAKKKSVESESDNFDSDLEDEIDKLAKDPKVQKKKKKSKEDEEEDVKPTKGNKKGMKEEKDKKSKGKKEEKGDSDSSDGTDNYDPEEAGEEEEEEEPMDTVDAPQDLSDRGNSSTEVEGSDADSDDSSDSEVVINSPKKKKGGKAGSKKAKNSESSDSDAPKKKKRLRTKLLDAKLSESDDSDFQVSKKGKGKKRKAKTDSSEDEESTEEDSDAPKKKGRGKKSAVSKQKGKKGKQTKRRRIKVASDSSEEKMSTEGEEEMKNEKKKKKKKKGSSSEEDGSDEDEDEDGEGSPSKGRKKIRKIKSDKKLTDSTRKAVKAEEERRKRIAEKQKQFNNVVVEDDPSSPNKCPITKQLVLEYDKETKEPVIEVDKRIVTKLKPHQVEAAQFMWDCTIESLERTKKEKGAGCILAHCMGLGKTLSVITFLHTVMSHSELTGITKALVVGPLNTVLNWQNEFETWLSGDLGEEFYQVYEISSVKQNVARAEMLKDWHKHGGVMIIGYEMFRNLTQGNHCRSKKLKQIFRDTLVNPGPDICVCDEGHILKNDASAISKAMNQIVTLKRIVLTGTPLQNNLIEYHCMVNFVKPNLLGTRKEFSNRFVNPIVNGQCTDSSSHDVRLMKRRAHIIHEKLAGCVQRKDYSALTKFLSPKYEYVISVRLTKVQIELYQKYLDKTGSANNSMGKGAKLFSDYQALMRIWTHPWVLKMDEVRQEKKAKWDDEDSFVDDESMSENESISEASKSSSSESDVVAISDNSSDEDDDKPRRTRASREAAGSSKDTEEVVVNAKGEVVKKWTTRSRGGEGTEWEGIIKAAEEEQEERPLTTDWWADYVTEEDATRIELSGKLSLLFEILRMSEEIGDKVLVFSQSLLSLDLIEDFLEHVDKKHQEEAEEKEKKLKEEEEEKKKEEGKDGESEDKEKDKEDKEEEKKEDEQDENVFGKQWAKGVDYFRMDGSTSAQHRKDLASSFNDPENYRARLFIISTKAGGLGINLVAANRVIIFDASWNPSNDVQSVFRVYRFGQNKPVYIYRFLAQGTMEEKIYERQVTKQSLSQRVVDEHQIERHFTSHDLQVLYTFKPDRLDDPNREERPTPELPKDHMLAEMLQSHKEWICSYHKHDSLLENQLNEELTEEERKAAWKEFEEEKQGIANNVRQQFMGMNNFQGMAGVMGPNINMNMLMQQGLRLPAMGGMPGSNMPFNQQNLLQLVQDMKTRFPNLPEDQLTARVQGVIRHIITSQYMQQQEMQKRQLEQREMQHQQQLHQIQAQIQRQQQQLNAQRMGGNFSQQPNNRR